MRPRSYLELCAEFTSRETKRHRQEVRGRKWRERRRSAAHVAILALFGFLFVLAAAGVMMW